MNAKDKVEVTESLEVSKKSTRADAEEKIKQYAAAAGITPQQLKNVIRSSLANSPCPKCGSETRRHQGEDGEDLKKPTRICSNKECRTVVEN